MALFRKKETPVPRRRKTDPEREAQTEEERGNDLFRRNRTLVGSVSPNISSANELGGSLQSPRAHSHHLSQHRRHLGSLFLLFFLGAMAMIWLLYEFTAGIQIAPANVDTASLDTPRYSRAITDYLAGRPIERVRTLTDRSDLTAYLQRVTPEVAGVESIGSGGFAASRYEIVFRKPVASWLIGSDLYFVDKTGVPFRINYFAAPKVKIVDNSGVPQVAGTVVASSNFLRFVGLAVDSSHAFGMQVKQAIIPEDTTRQIELRIAKASYPIKLSLDRPVGEQVEDMKRAVDYLKRKKIVPKQYLDVRVSGKAYYR